MLALLRCISGLYVTWILEALTLQNANTSATSIFYNNACFLWGPFLIKVSFFLWTVTVKKKFCFTVSILTECRVKRHKEKYIDWFIFFTPLFWKVHTGSNYHILMHITEQVAFFSTIFPFLWVPLDKCRICNNTSW